MATSKVLQSSRSRVFLIEGRAAPNNAPSYESCMRMQGLSQSFGDIEKVECPDPYQYGKFVEVAQIRGSSERVTTTLEGRYAMDLLSTLLTLARRSCAIDVQLHLGDCTNPSEFDNFEKAIVLEDAYLTSYGTDDLGALQSGDNSVVNETADISAADVYEIRKLQWAEKAASLVTVEMVDVVIADTLSCGGDCEQTSTGCRKIYGITTAIADGAELVYSIDGGTTWYEDHINVLGDLEAPNQIDQLGDYLIITSQDASSYSYVLKSELDGTGAVTFNEVPVLVNAPIGIHSVGNFAIIVGENGYIWKITSVSAGLEVLDAGSATVSNLNAVHMLDPDHAVAVGAAGAVVYTQNGTLWSAASVPAAVVLNTVFMRTKDEWWVGGADGNVYVTTNAGVSWSTVSFSGSGAGSVTSIVFSTRSVGYIAHATATPVGRILRTYNGGYTWNVLPEGTGTLPGSPQTFNALAGCQYDANFLLAVGLGALTDGVIIQGEAS